MPRGQQAHRVTPAQASLARKGQPGRQAHKDLLAQEAQAQQGHRALLAQALELPGRQALRVTQVSRERPEQARLELLALRGRPAQLEVTLGRQARQVYEASQELLARKVLRVFRAQLALRVSLAL